MKATRRGVLRGAIAIALAGAAAPPAQPGAVPVPPPAPPPPAPAPAANWGYSLDGGEWWHGGFPSRAAAWAEAKAKAEVEDDAEGAASFSTAMLHPRGITYPTDLAERAAEWLADGGWFIAGNMADWMDTANQDNDYEGDFSTECGSKCDDLEEPGRAAVVSAIRRAGFDGVADAVAARKSWPDLEPIFPEVEAAAKAIANDAQLDADLLAVLTEWTGRHNLQRELLTLDTTAELAHGDPEEEAP